MVIAQPLGWGMLGLRKEALFFAAAYQCMTSRTPLPHPPAIVGVRSCVYTQHAGGGGPHPLAAVGV